MFVVATAGHVDHGKSTLARALTGMEPDRWEEEKRRGLTIDLGFVWTRLPSGADVAFVDVPGHERFLGNMLAGIGPAPVVLFVVAADEGWQAQSTDHRDAIAALGISYGLVALTRADRADVARRLEVEADVRRQLHGTALADAPILTVSAKTGEGIDELRAALDEILAAAPSPDPEQRMRLWVDRSFSVKGSGTVVTGTLAAGTLRVGDSLELLNASGTEPIEVRGLHSENTAVEAATPVTRVAVNLRGIDAEAISRGDALLSPGTWRQAELFDVRRTSGDALDAIAQDLVAHTGTAGVEAHVRPLSADFARIRLSQPLALELGDRFVLRGPGARHVLAGVEVVDLNPPQLRRRGAAARWAEQLAGQQDYKSPALTLQQRGYALIEDLRRDGYTVDTPPAGVIAFSKWWITAAQVGQWKQQLSGAVADHAAANPLAVGLPRGAARDALGLSEDALLNLAVAAAKLESVEGAIRAPGAVASLGAAEEGVAKLEQRLQKEPFAAPEAADLKDLRLGSKELAAAERAGRILRLKDGVVLLPSAVAEARTRLQSIDQPFSTSQARQALGTTRRVAIPLLEYLDEKGVTRRLDGAQRELR
ncbi:translation elongation factor [Corynebacterium striatum]|uniref:selenocysteine-specific translation elongation factor n=1 Tax=Corynebacterium striatum TaxID=43770 RepID=UPI000C1CC996|nr:selenocysteine-specific translation elongation factor [Corynebacterium striatum]PIS61491.1 translation elongation factor [Corynebacterium striatum]PXY03664.1 selenocysteine-specific translation elongation factor [Corynebacterium striatum]PXY05369.1 selenocysteine-specific translation elongation factor [Corynebacterium striatum]